MNEHISETKWDKFLNIRTSGRGLLFLIFYSLTFFLSQTKSELLYIWAAHFFISFTKNIIFDTIVLIITSGFNKTHIDKNQNNHLVFGTIVS